MNELILEFNAQADKYAWEKVGKKYDNAGDLNWQWEDAKMTEFARLLVQECAKKGFDIFDEEPDAPLGDLQFYVRDGIMKHFGVEK
jgi:hypothetical protein